MKNQIHELNNLLHYSILKLHTLTDYINDNDSSVALIDHQHDLKHIIKQLDKILN